MQYTGWKVFILTTCSNRKLILIISIPDSLCNLHVDDHHHPDQSTDCHDVRHIPENTGIEISC